jgi:hypothetical protein
MNISTLCIEQKQYENAYCRELLTISDSQNLADFLRIGMIISFCRAIINEVLYLLIRVT